MKRILINPIILILLFAAAGILFLLIPLKPKAEWDSSSETRIITIGYRGEVDYNYIHNVQVWGDGHIVWVEHDLNGNRQVLEGNLSEGEMADLISRFIEADFFEGYQRFDWDFDFGKYININLLNINHDVTEVDKTYQSIGNLISFLESGAGAKATDFIPTTGKLIVYTREEVKLSNLEAKYQWPDDKFGYGLESVHNNKPHNEIHISGEELAFAWEIVNTHTPLVESNDEVYWIAVMVPKISLF